MPLNDEALRDAAGTLHVPADGDCRIVCLVPSITELLFALGVGSRVVGRTGFCIHPREAVRAVAKVGGTKDVDLARVQALAPTHVIVNVDENTLATVQALRATVPHVVVTHPHGPADNAALYALLGGIFHARAAAQRLTAQLHAELAACAAVEWRRERVLYLIWRDPWMTVAPDTYIAGTLDCVGWDVPGTPGGWAGAARYPVIEDLDAAVRGVARVLLSSEPYRFDRDHVQRLQARWPQVPVQLIDGEWTSWYGSRAIAGLAALRRARMA